MSARKRNLDSLFDAARSEHSPITAEASRALVAGAAPTRSPFMSPTFIVSSALALATAAGITIKIIHEDDGTKNRIVQVSTSQEQRTSPVIPTGSEEQNVNKEVRTAVIPNDSEEPSTVKRVRIVTKPSTLNPNPLASFGLTALVADDDIVQSLGLEPRAVQEICRNLAGADSLTNCSIDMSDAKVKVCVFKDGTPDEVVFMDKPGPMPVMFTSSDGKGHVVASHFSHKVDPNKLVPVAAQGCGDNMIMWFQPTQDFVMSMPDSLSEDLKRVLDVEVRIETKDGKTTVRQRQRNADGSVTEEIETLDSRSVFDVPEFNINVDSIMKSVNVDSIMRSMDIQIKDANQTMKIFIDKQMFTVDSTLKTLDTVLKNFQQQKMIFKFNDEEAVIEHNSCDPRTQQFMFMNSPNIRSRVIIMTKGVKRPATPVTPQVIEHASLQETRTSQGAIAATMLYPNPTSDGGATMSFSLSEPRTLNMSLLTLSGEKVMDLARNVYRTQGDGQLAFALNNSAPGMYLVVLETDQGERVVQRLIVQ